MSRADRQPFETDARLSWSLTGNHRARPRPARGDHCSLISPAVLSSGSRAPRTAEGTRIRQLLRIEPAASAVLKPIGLGAWHPERAAPPPHPPLRLPRLEALREHVQQEAVDELVRRERRGLPTAPTPNEIVLPAE
jgi:hypothetical protein